MLSALLRNAQKNKSVAVKTVRNTTTFNIGNIKVKVDKPEVFVKKHVDATITHGENSVTISVTNEMSEQQNITIIFDNGKFERHTRNIITSSELTYAKEVQNIIIELMKMRNNVKQVKEGTHIYDFICETNAEKIKSATSIRTLRNIFIPPVKVEKTDEEKAHAKLVREQKAKEKQKMEKSNKSRLDLIKENRKKQK